MGETLPQLEIAKKYVEIGGEAIFFSHGGEYEYLANENGFEIVKLKSLQWENVMTDVNRDKMQVEKQYLMVYTTDTIKAFVEEEIKIFKKAEINLVISSFNPTCSISARVVKIPLVVLISGTTSSLYYGSGFATFPENFENVFTKMLPASFKKYFTRWMLLNNKFLVKKFNKIAKQYNIRTFRTVSELLEGDHPLLCDDINFLGAKPTKKIPKENFIGPVSMGVSDNQVDEIEKDVKKHLERPGKSILFIMGSSPTRKLFVKILDTVKQRDYNIIAVYAIIRRDRLPETKENILLKQYIKSPQIVTKMVDLAIIHGGRGAVYNAAYSGTPSIGIPNFFEQQYNIDNLVRSGAGLRVSGKFFKPEELLNAIDTIFNNYDTFLKKAQELSAKLQKGPMGEKALQRIIEILEEQAIK